MTNGRRQSMKKTVRTVMLLIAAVMCFAACGKKSGQDASKQAEERNADNELPVIKPTAEPEITPTAEPSGQPDVTPTEEGNGNKENKEGTMGAAKVLYQGHGSVRFTTAEGKTIYVDPFMGDGYDVPADLILITHGHYDHTQTQLITTKNPDCRTITFTEALSGGTHQTFDLGYVKVEAVEAGYNKNHDVKQCVGYILTFSDGVKVYVSGDTSTTKDMETFAAKNLDYAFFCCDGVYNMNMEEAIACAKLVGAKHSIPYHMVPANENGFDQSVAEQFDVPGRIILKPGEELVLE